MLFSKRRRYKLVVYLQTVVRDQVSLSEKLEFIKYQNRIMLQRFSCISFLSKPLWLSIVLKLIVIFNFCSHSAFRLAHFSQMFHFYTSWKRLFLTFSVGIEMEQ